MDSYTLALHDAVRKGDEAGMLMALELGGCINAKILCKDSVERAVLSVAAEHGHAHLISTLVGRGAALEGRDSRGITPLLTAAREGHTSALKALIHAGANIEAKEDQYSNSGLHLTAMHGRLGCAMALVEFGCSVSPRDINGYTPLHVASRSNNLSIIKYLVESGCEKDAITSNGWTAMHVAGMSGNEDVVKFLYTHGLSVNAQDNEGRTPAVLTDQCGCGHVYWYFVKTFGMEALTALTPAVKAQQSMERYDLEEYVHQWAGRDGHENPILLQRNIPEPFDGYYQDQRGYTALHIAAEGGRLQIVELLIGPCQMFPKVITHNGETPEMLARKHGHSYLADVINSHLIFTQSREQMVNLYGKLLHIIASEDDVKRASSLLSAGCPMQPVGNYYTDATILALTLNRRRILTLLVAAGAGLSTNFQGLNLLQVAWFTPEVTMFNKMVVTRSTQHVLEQERMRVTRWPDLHDGICGLLDTLKGEKPWMARWPVSKDQSLNALLTMSVQARCNLASAFLQREGARPACVTHCEGCPLHMALQISHWPMIKRLLLASGHLYTEHSPGTRYLDLLPPDHRNKLEQDIYEQEHRKLMNEKEKAKDDEVKEELQNVINLHADFFYAYVTNGQLTLDAPMDLRLTALLEASQFGLVQFCFLLLTLGKVDVNSEIKGTLGSTALHYAAAFGHQRLIFLLYRMGANLNKPDQYQHTPLHLAPMFGHYEADRLLKELTDGLELRCRAGTTPTEVKANFQGYVRQYGINPMEDNDFMEYDVFNNKTKALEMHLSRLNLDGIQKQCFRNCVDYSIGEAREVHHAVLEGMELLKDEIGKFDEMFKGEIVLLGSSADGTRLYAPDEFDINLVVETPAGLTLDINKLGRKDSILQGHTSELKLQAKGTQLEPVLCNSVWKNRFYRAVEICLRNFCFKDPRLSLVPPGLTRTQVGVALSLAWQGKKNPLLLVGVDFVPVLSAPWPREVDRPWLTPNKIQDVFVSSLGKGKWRFSFANAEVATMMNLDTSERQVFLACKYLLSRLKAEAWMPKVIKDRFTWWDFQRWKLSVPPGFALKNCFLKTVEQKRLGSHMWREEDLMQHMVQVFSLMLGEEIDSSTNEIHSVSPKIYPYYGGAFESPKMCDGTKEIVSFINKSQQKELEM